MPDWNDLLLEINDIKAQADNKSNALKAQGAQRHDLIRRKYLKKLHEVTGRNTIIYYSGWLQKPGSQTIAGITDGDKIGFMTTIHSLDRSKGLDLILHTPGGEMAATESLVDYTP